MTATNEITGPLAGYRILDLTNVLFGPLATRNLGDLGADVIKVEGLAGDLWRYTGHARNHGMGGQFMAVNRNKRSVAVDLKHADGAAVLQEMVKSADVVISNIRPEGLARLGAGYEQCKALNPDLIYVSATGFGQDGPWKARPAFDEIIQAASGFSTSIGSESEPQFVPSLIADKVCGLELVSAVMAALLHRERTGEGQQVEVPMLETLAAFNSIEMLGGYAFHPPTGDTGYDRLRERRPARTKDGWLAMLPYTGGQWQAFFEATGLPECIEEFGVLDAAQRARNIDRLYAKLHEMTPSRTTAEWCSLLADLDIPFADFASLNQQGEMEHLHAVELFLHIQHPTEGEIIQARPPVKYSASPAGIHRVPPQLGEHTEEVLSDLGYSTSQIEQLIDSGVVRQSSAKDAERSE